MICLTLCDMSVTLCDMSVTLCDMSVTLCDMDVTLCDMYVTLCDRFFTLLLFSVYNQFTQTEREKNLFSLKGESNRG